MSAALDQVRTRPRITVDEYYRMVEDGRLDPDARVELIDGEILAMAPIGSDHAGTSDGLASDLIRALPQRLLVRIGTPLRLDNRSEPQPDLTIVRHRADRYRASHPTPADVLLVIEVADTSLSKDQGIKRRAYARAGIAEYWIIDLHARIIEIHRDPRGETYAHVERRADGSVALAADPSVIVSLEGIL